MTGSGTVQYKDGYLITITSINIVIDFGQWLMKTHVMNLALEKGIPWFCRRLRAPI